MFIQRIYSAQCQQYSPPSSKWTHPLPNKREKLCLQMTGTCVCCSTLQVDLETYIKELFDAGLDAGVLPTEIRKVGWAAEASQAADEAVRPFEGPVHAGKVELSCHAITCFWWKAYLVMSAGIHVRCFSSRHVFHSFRFW